MQVILYPNGSGGVAVFYPAADALAQLGIRALAQMQVPAGRPYKIADASVIPTDRSLRTAWTVDEADLTDGVGADWGEGSGLAVAAWLPGPIPVLRRRVPQLPPVHETLGDYSLPADVRAYEITADGVLSAHGSQVTGPRLSPLPVEEPQEEQS